MPDYRFYSIRPDGHITKPPAEKSCPDDLAAMKEAQQLMDGEAIEIWEQTRIVAYLTPDQK
jgi:hypothetical protein